jgi:hypothetical protein
MSYLRFGAMIATSTVVMFALMYLNTYAWEHVFFSETRVYMAIMMGATMAVVMLAYMLGMYTERRLNGDLRGRRPRLRRAALWLVRSQATVSGVSYMRAMIPHHSIAIMTSERAQIRDPRVAKLAHEIVEAQRREIAEMRYLVGQVSDGNTVETIYRDPPARLGSVAEALGTALISTLDLAPLTSAEADQILEPGPRCAFNRSPETDPVLWTSAQGAKGAMKLNGILVTLDRQSEGVFAADGATVAVRPLGPEADWRANADLVFALEQGLSVGYRGFWSCPS